MKIKMKILFKVVIRLLKFQNIVPIMFVSKYFPFDANRIRAI